MIYRFFPSQCQGLSRFASIIPALFLAVLLVVGLTSASAWCDEPELGTIFQIGEPDGFSNDLGFFNFDQAIADKANPAFRFKVGSNRSNQFPRWHAGSRDFHNAGHTFTFAIEFDAEKNYDTSTYLFIGITFCHSTEPSLFKIVVNGTELPKLRATPSDAAAFEAGFESNTMQGMYASHVFEVPADCIRRGNNELTITLEEGSWLLYDYLILKETPNVPIQQVGDNLLEKFRINELTEQGIKEILFVVRKPGEDPHWYANFGYYSLDENTYPFPLGTGARLCLMNLETKEVRTILETQTGSIRDPQIDYSGEKLIFSYFGDGQKHYNLYEINIDGSGLRQITSGDWDDIEPSYLPNGDIVFCSSRCKRWVQCWLTPVATIHRCGPNGEDIRELSCNVEHDNTPWVLNNGQVLYMRWEYIDRSQVHYHHLWTMNPDGTRQQVFYGNFNPGMVFLAAKPIVGSDKVVVSFSPGHGIREHYGQIAVLTPRQGPDDEGAATIISRYHDHADPWAFSETAFMAVRKERLQFVDEHGREEDVYILPHKDVDEGFWVHEPRPVIGREREPIIAENVDPTAPIGSLLLTDIYDGRQMDGIERGSIKELIVLETLPEPIHFNGGMEQVSSGGTFTINRIIGTVPVNPDGSAFFEVPALRPVYFIALDQNGQAVKKMHSFTSVMPGEVSTCIGCHEHRTNAPTNAQSHRVFDAAHRGVAPITPVADIPEVFSFPRDIQPILDRHCATCHHYEDPQAGVDLSGDWNIRYSMSYDTLSGRAMLGDNRNQPISDFAPYKIGSAASSLYRLIEEGHQGAALDDHEKKMVRFWLNAGGNYTGTYAANGHEIGRAYHESGVFPDLQWEEITQMNEALNRRCDNCHNERRRQLPHALSVGGRYNTQRIFNLTRPDKSIMVRAPLAKDAGGLGICKTVEGNPIITDKEDADYLAILGAINRGRYYQTHESQRFSLGTPIVPNRSYVREMVRYGVLPPDHDFKTPVDPYEVDQKYWQSLWYTPKPKR